MNPYVLAAGIASVAMGLVHSVLGERLLLTELLRRQGLPPVLGSSRFSGQILRFAWHVTTVLLWTVATLLFVLAERPAGGEWTLALRIVAAGNLGCALVAGTITRGRHFAWLGFLAIAALAWLGSR